MRVIDVLNNLKKYGDQFKYSNYPLSKEEAEVCIAAMEIAMESLNCAEED